MLAAQQLEAAAEGSSDTSRKTKVQHSTLPQAPATRINPDTSMPTKVNAAAWRLNGAGLRACQ